MHTDMAGEREKKRYKDLAGPEFQPNPRLAETEMGQRMGIQERNGVGGGSLDGKMWSLRQKFETPIGGDGAVVGGLPEYAQVEVTPNELKLALGEVFGELLTEAAKKNPNLAGVRAEEIGVKMVPQRGVGKDEGVRVEAKIKKFPATIDVGLTIRNKPEIEDSVEMLIAPPYKVASISKEETIISPNFAAKAFVDKEQIKEQINRTAMDYLEEWARNKSGLISQEADIAFGVEREELVITAVRRNGMDLSIEGLIEESKEEVGVEEVSIGQIQKILEDPESIPEQIEKARAEKLKRWESWTPPEDAQEIIKRNREKIAEILEGYNKSEYQYNFPWGKDEPWAKDFFRLVVELGIWDKIKSDQARELIGFSEHSEYGFQVFGLGIISSSNFGDLIPPEATDLFRRGIVSLVDTCTDWYREEDKNKLEGMISESKQESVLGQFAKLVESLPDQTQLWLDFFGRDPERAQAVFEEIWQGLGYRRDTEGDFRPIHHLREQLTDQKVLEEWKDNRWGLVSTTIRDGLMHMWHAGNKENGKIINGYIDVVALAESLGVADREKREGNWQLQAVWRGLLLGE